VLNQDRITIPDRTYPCEVLVPTSLLIEVCQELKGIGESLKLSITEDHMRFEASDEMMSAQITVTDKVNMSDFSKFMLLSKFYRRRLLALVFYVQSPTRK